MTIEVIWFYLLRRLRFPTAYFSEAHIIWYEIVRSMWEVPSAIAIWLMTSLRWRELLTLRASIRKGCKCQSVQQTLDIPDELLARGGFMSSAPGDVWIESELNWARAEQIMETYGRDEKCPKATRTSKNWKRTQSDSTSTKVSIHTWPGNDGNWRGRAWNYKIKCQGRKEGLTAKWYY